ATRRLICAPQLPTVWPSACLSALRFGEMQAQIEVAALPAGVRVRLETTDPRWTITLGAVLPAGANIINARINEEPVALAPTSLGAEGRDVWLAPAIQGASFYELSVSWSRAAQFTGDYREGKDHIHGVSSATR